MNERQKRVVEGIKIMTMTNTYQWMIVKTKMTVMI